MTSVQSNESHLETGWDSTTPAGDTLMRSIALTIADEATSLVSALGGRVERNADFHVADLGKPAAHSNVAVLMHPLTADTADDVMQRLQAFFDIGGTSSGMCGIFSVWRCPDLRPWGWQLMGHPPAHFLPAGGRPGADPEGVTFHMVTTDAELAEWESGARASILDDVPPDTLTDIAILDDHRRCHWIARVDGQTAGIASSYAGEDITYIALVGTLPAFRRRGIGTALTWRAALADPANPACLLSSDEGRLAYDRMGFFPLIRCTLWYRLR